MRLSFNCAQLPNINCIQSGGHLCCPPANFIIPKNKAIYLQYFLQYFCFFFCVALFAFVIELDFSERGGPNFAVGNGTKQSTEINY